MFKIMAVLDLGITINNSNETNVSRNRASRINSVLAKKKRFLNMSIFFNGFCQNR